MNRRLFEYSYTLRKQKQRQFLFILLYCLVIYAVVNLILAFLIYPIRQKSVSMTPDVPQDSLVFVTPIDTNPSRGDVVLIHPLTIQKLSFFQKVSKNIVAFFTAQQIQLYEDKTMAGNHSVVRRVVGMPGDTIYMRDYVLYIKAAGEKHFLTEFEVIDKPYNVNFYTAPSDWNSDLGVKGSFEEITLKDNEYFVLGDNRKSCSDSRLWGAVEKSDITGRALLCYFPFKSMRIY